MARSSDSAVRALVAAVGNDLRELATACSQLVADIGGAIDEEKVSRYYRGKAEATGFVVADRAVDGDVAGALEVLRWGLDVGLAPVLVTSALAGNLRTIAKVAQAGRGSAQSLVKQLGMPSWKIEKAQRQSRAWQPAGIARAIAAVAAADAEVKGAGTDPAYALERAVLAIVAARGPLMARRGPSRGGDERTMLLGYLQRSVTSCCGRSTGSATTTPIGSVRAAASPSTASSTTSPTSSARGSAAGSPAGAGCTSAASTPSTSSRRST